MTLHPTLAGCQRFNPCPTQQKGDHDPENEASQEHQQRDQGQGRKGAQNHDAHRGADEKKACGEGRESQRSKEAGA
jgi:hypothetical protein